MKIKAVLFDLDGTLMNTLEDLTDSTNYILEKHNFPKRTIKEIRSFVGNGIKKLMERAVPQNTDEKIINECYEEMLTYYKEHSLIKTAPYVGTVGNGIKKLMERAVPQNTDEKIINECYEEMLTYYKEHSLIKTAPYVGTRELVEKLHQEEFKIAIITNKAQNSADVIAEKFFGKSVDLVIGDDKKMPLKPNPSGIEKALEYFKISKDEAVYVGDSEVDLQTGNNGNLKTILVLWGFRDRDFLEEKGGKVFAETVEELENLIKTI